MESFRQILKRYCGMTYKKPLKKDRRSTGMDNLIAKFEYSALFLTLYREHYDFIFVDEISLGHTYSPPRCWQLKKEPKIQVQTQRHQQISILGALGTNGFLAYQIVLGTINGRIYEGHLIELLKLLRQHYEERNIVIILDNSQVHKSSIVKRILNGIHHKFLPTYSPQLNPIEKLWHGFKQHLNKQGDLLMSGICTQIHKYLNSITPRSLDKCIYSITPYMKKGLNKVVF